jgi:Dolichyl-phosphate-mannose-protein mannosyltransferase
MVLRFGGISLRPGGLDPDEAVEGLSALQILANPAAVPVFFASDGGREALYAWIVAGTFAVTGPSVEALRGTAALLGVLGVLAIGLLARRVGWIESLAAMAWAAGSAWLVAVSRDGFRNVIVLPLEGLALAGLLLWAERPTRLRAALAGVAVALASFYSYTPMRLLPVLVLAWLLWLRRTGRDDAMRTTLPTFGAAFGLVALPIVIVVIADPVSYFARSATVAIVPSIGLGAIVEHTLRTLGMFAFTGDPNPRHDVGSWPLLLAPFAILGLIGLARLLRDRREPGPALMLVTLVGFTVPPLLAGEGSTPHFLRALGLAAPLAVTVGIGTADAMAWLRTRAASIRSRRAASWAPAAVGVLFAGGFAAAALATGVAYLTQTPTQLYMPYRADLVALAELADRGDQDLVLLTDEDAYTVQFLDVNRPAPEIVAPTVRLVLIEPKPGQRVFAVDPAAFAMIDLGANAAARTHPLAWDPQGNPTVWVVEPAP